MPSILQVPRYTSMCAEVCAFPLIFGKKTLSPVQSHVCGIKCNSQVKTQRHIHNTNFEAACVGFWRKERSGYSAKEFHLQHPTRDTWVCSRNFLHNFHLKTSLCRSHLFGWVQHDLIETKLFWSEKDRSNKNEKPAKASANSLQVSLSECLVAREQRFGCCTEGQKSFVYLNSRDCFLVHSPYWWSGALFFSKQRRLFHLPSEVVWPKILFLLVASERKFWQDLCPWSSSRRTESASEDGSVGPTNGRCPAFPGFLSEAKQYLRVETVKTAGWGRCANVFKTEIVCPWKATS